MDNEWLKYEHRASVGRWMRLWGRGEESAGGRCPEIVRSDGLAKERLAEGARFVMGVRKGDGECEALARGEGFEGEVADGAAVVAAG